MKSSSSSTPERLSRIVRILARVYGVSVARRGWLGPDDVFNTHGLKAAEKELKRLRQRVR